MRPAVITTLALIALPACGGDSNAPNNVPSPLATKLAFTVEPTTTTAGQVLAPPVQVSVEDASGTVVSSATTPVTLTLGANPSAGALGGSVTVDAAAGVATFSDIQVSKPGSGYSLTASAPNLAAASSAAFDISPVPGIPAAIAAVAGGGQTATVAEAVGTSPSVKVTDGLGNPVQNIAVTFAIGLGGGSLDEADQITDATGVATVGQWILGTSAGANTLLATASGVEAPPVTFTATAIAGPAAALMKVAGDDQIASPGTPVAEPPAVLVTDVYGNPLLDVPIAVKFVVASGGGSITGGLQATGSNGVATVGSWTLGDHPGPNTLTAKAAVVPGSLVTFHATVTPLPTAVTVTVNNNFFQSVRNGSHSGDIFTYATDTVAVGGTVTWEWVGQNHNVTPVFGSAGTGSGTHDAPFSYSKSFDAPGVYAYRCTNHSQLIFDLAVGMTGIVVIR